ncbi:(Na+)-NQR maturation NqrM [uncultured Pseudoteredinibacter sp.]|uniref:(Na+)-NQR maturation NqrM n=1 Tax=uncultured Pseudoteredinibacter sp. TaxID=1641701 RepID=UPI0026142EAA|nr:(Na+)-NQR maturation NqrM [uncultured Pseudoteredinibacter sp.]
MIYVVAFGVITLLVVMMSIGVLMGRKPISGSCGGVGDALKDPNYVCDICGGDESKCEEEKMGKSNAAEESGKNDLFNDAMKK